MDIVFAKGKIKMKTITAREKQSLFSKLINAIKDSALFNMIANPDFGTYVDSDELSQEQKVKRLAQETKSTEAEIKALDAEFAKATKVLSSLTQSVSEIPSRNRGNNKDNIYKVDESELNRNVSNQRTTHDEQSHEDKGIEL